MIAINEEDRQTISLTRGDAPSGGLNKIIIRYPLYNFETEQVEYYKFHTTDELTLNIYEKKGYTKKEILSKTYKLSDIGYIEETDKPELYITAEDTMLFPLENKKKTYMYEVVLNDTNTIIGANDKGTNKIIVYPGVKEADNE